mmetsp:Transcript_19342/g.31677  ORF Transcript_19342/g.31677 Transcript_19342/m.31677 type:complete len:388 (-) Transcript_19342:120-1283(-)|eukprot:CAMPEP_0184670454 /NCGR_PEP_ID=MMETSP0308-20130426/82284_1 /TAXON_ID=38269 /ORGANISM="Gloeochaete witrockiana, Strain SAG 46.84" /LENGTH=387 /DNA_ID=CAMNT_0027117201 /DNA_START=195 /DNA_END=1358 /DNA_ORIENTATION=+
MALRALILASFVCVSLLSGFSAAQVDEIAPAPPSIGSFFPAVYFGPPPSSVNPALVGPNLELKAGKVDDVTGTVTLPLYRGALRSGETVWYIVTDTTDLGIAQSLGLNYSPKIGFAVGKAVRSATLAKTGSLIFQSGRVDFRPRRVIVPGAAPDYFPPSRFQPGSVGDAAYSPLVRVENILGGVVLNAPIVAFGVNASQINFCSGSPNYDLVHDKVVKICPRDMTVTLYLTTGFSFAKPVVYLSTDANNLLPAAFEAATYAPGMLDIQVGGDDSLFSPVERLFAFVNGPTGRTNPQRQGFNSALSNGGGPLNVLGGIPSIATDYSPLWDLNVGVWTAEAIRRGYRSRLTEEFAILGFAQRGFITGPGGAPYGSSGLVVNCPIVKRFL